MSCAYGANALPLLLLSNGVPRKQTLENSSKWRNTFASHWSAGSVCRLSTGALELEDAWAYGEGEANAALLEEVPPSINWSTPSKKGWARACCGNACKGRGGQVCERR